MRKQALHSGYPSSIIMTPFVIAVGFTIFVSAFCSILEAMVLSTTTAEVQALKKRSPKKGRRLEDIQANIDDTISAILTLNTIANTAGAAVVGALAADLWSDVNIWFGSVTGLVAGIMTFTILIFSEIIPKNAGVAYRSLLQPHMIIPLIVIRISMRPITYFTRSFVRLLVKEQEASSEDAEEEIKLLAEKGAKEGKLGHAEANVISNALTLDNIAIADIMTPRTVMFSLDKDNTLETVFKDFPNIPFARIPVYEETIDQVVGIVRRRDLLASIANDDHEMTVEDLMEDVLFIPDTANAADALQSFLAKQQQLGVVVDEFGSITGVVAMEDIIEHILGREIFEKDDIAVDMRELARAKSAQKRGREMRLTQSSKADPSSQS